MQIFNLFLLFILVIQSGSCRKGILTADQESASSDVDKYGDTARKSGKSQSTVYSYLALGDSYTIGESVPDASNYPNQTVNMLKKQRWKMEHPQIIAVTGWATDDLEAALQKKNPGHDYDEVSLLIGVNDQYRGYSPEHYKAGFEQLLKQAIDFARGKASHVVVLSIPDWSVTPFAPPERRDAIAAEIAAFNVVNYKISERYKVHYINITPDTQKMGENSELIAHDGLHPSGKEYLVWSKKLASVMVDILKN